MNTTEELTPREKKYKKELQMKQLGEFLKAEFKEGFWHFYEIWGGKWCFQTKINQTYVNEKIKKLSKKSSDNLLIKACDNFVFTAEE